MAESAAAWYLGSGEQQTGPYTDQQVLDKYLDDEINDDTLCWKAGQADWLPLKEVEPFAAVVAKRRDPKMVRFACPDGHTLYVHRDFAGKSVKCERCGARCVVPLPVSIWRRLMPVGVAVLVLAAAGVAYFLLVDPAAIREAERCIAEKRYKDAGAALVEYAEKHPDDAHATYLMGIAFVGTYAGAERGQNLVLDQGHQTLEKALTLDERWREPAGEALKATSRAIPDDAPDFAQRFFSIARLRAALEVADTDDLAKEVLDLAGDAPRNQARQYLHHEITRQLIEWDPDCAADLIELCVETVGDTGRGLDGLQALLNGAAVSNADITAQVCEELDSQARRLARERPADAESLLWKALGQCPDKSSELCRRLLGVLERRATTEGSAADTLKSLRRLEPLMPDGGKDIAALYLTIARRLADTDPDTARESLNHAAELDADLLDNERNALLRLRLWGEPDDDKLSQCEVFLDRFANSSHRQDVLAMIVTDAAEQLMTRPWRDSKIAGPRPRYGSVPPVTGPWRESTTEPYVVSARQAADKLLSAPIPRAEHVQAVFGLAQGLARVRQNEAFEIAEQILTKVPDTAMRPRIESEVNQWRTAQASSARPEPPTSETRRDYPTGRRSSDRRTTPAPPPPPPPSPEVATVDTPGELGAALAGGAPIVWIRLSRDELDDSLQAAIKDWVGEGGVLWVDTDIAHSIGFSYFSNERPSAERSTRPARLEVVPEELASGRATVVHAGRSPLAALAGQTLEFDLAPSRLALVTNRSMEELRGRYRVTPVLTRAGNTGSGDTIVLAAVRKIRDGHVLLRPRVLDAESETGKAFDEALRRYCGDLRGRPRRR